MPGAHLVQHRAEGKQIGAAVEFFSADLFGAHVRDGADGGAGTGEIFFVVTVGAEVAAAELSWRQFCEAEIENFGLTAW